MTGAIVLDEESIAASERVNLCLFIMSSEINNDWDRIGSM